MIDRAELVLIDLAGQESEFEVRYALQRLGAKKVLIISDREQTIESVDLTETRAIRRPPNPLPENEFIRRIRDWFEKAAKELAPKLAVEPTRLLAKGEYRAAVVANVTRGNTARVSANKFRPKGQASPPDTITRFWQAQ
jgi:hypothetical protein